MREAARSGWVPASFAMLLMRGVSSPFFLFFKRVFRTGSRTGLSIDVRNSEPVDPREHYGVQHIGIKVDFESVYHDLQAKGADFLGEPFEPTPGIRLVFLREPNGAVIELAQRDPKVFGDAMAKGTVDW